MTKSGDDLTTATIGRLHKRLIQAFKELRPSSDYECTVLIHHRDKQAQSLVFALGGSHSNRALARALMAEAIASSVMAEEPELTPEAVTQRALQDHLAFFPKDEGTPEST